MDEQLYIDIIYKKVHSKDPDWTSSISILQWCTVECKAEQHLYIQHMQKEIDFWKSKPIMIQCLLLWWLQNMLNGTLIED